MILYLIIVISILYLWCIMPKINSKHANTLYEVAYYAHRGLHDNNSCSPENSLSAFKLAIENNYGIELDVRLSKDNIPVVFHDTSLERVCALDKKIRELTFDELKNLKLYNSEERIPLLTDVLEIINGEVPIIVELKIDGNDTSICNVVAPILDRYKGFYCIESFNPLIVYWYKKNRPNIQRGQLSTNYFKSGIKNDILLNFFLQNLLFNCVTKPNFIAYNYKYRKMLSYKLCHKLFKVPTFAYTIESSEALKKSINDFDYFIFEGFRP